MESQGIRLKDLEELLTQERRARETAEERIVQLEREALKDTVILDTADLDGNSEREQDAQAGEVNGDATETVPEVSSLTDAATARLQQKLEMMMNEMNEMKQQMERYRQRAETAEAESATHRTTLAEMVEKIRQDEASRVARDARRRSRSGDRLLQEASPADVDEQAEDDAEEGEITIINEKDMHENGSTTLFRKAGVQNGKPISPNGITEPKTSQALTTRPSPKDMAVIHGGPAASIFGIVLIGMGLMAWLNTYPKVER